APSGSRCRRSGQTAGRAARRARRPREPARRPEREEAPAREPAAGQDRKRSRRSAAKVRPRDRGTRPAGRAARRRQQEREREQVQAVSLANPQRANPKSSRWLVPINGKQDKARLSMPIRGARLGGEHGNRARLRRRYLTPSPPGLRGGPQPW